MPTRPPPSTGPPLDPGDVYLYAHGSGAISLARGDGSREPMVTLADARWAAEVTNLAGDTMWVAGDDAPLAVDTLSSTGGPGIHLEPFAARAAPWVWVDGATPVMQAIVDGRADLLEDLVARGADVRAADDAGFTALHHAAVAADHTAIGILLAAGANPGVRSRSGLTAAGLAERWGDPATARLLDPTRPGPVDDRSIGGEQRFHQNLWLGVAAATTVGIVVAFGSPIVALCVWAGILGLFFVFGPATVTILRACPPHRLEGTDLWVRYPLGAEKRIDLTGVTAADFVAHHTPGAVESSAQVLRHLLLAHPDGRVLGRWTRRVMRLDDDHYALLAGDSGRVVIVPTPAKNADAPGLAVGGLLESRGTRILPGLRGLLRRARWSTGFPGRRPPRAVDVADLEVDTTDDPGGDPASEPDLIGDIDFPSTGIRYAWFALLLVVFGTVFGVGIGWLVARDQGLVDGLFASLGGLIFAVGGILMLPAAFRGSPRRLQGDELEFARPLVADRVVDLTRATAIAATTPRWVPGTRYSPAAYVWSVVIAHPEGRRIDRKHLEALELPADAFGAGDPADIRVLALDLSDPPGVPITRSVGERVALAGGHVDRSVVDAITAASVTLGIMGDEPPDG